MYLRYFRPVKSISRFCFTQRNRTIVMNESETFPSIPLDPQPFAELWYPLLQQTMLEPMFLILLVDVRKTHRTHCLKDMATMIFNQSVFHSTHDQRDKEHAMAIIFAQMLRLVAGLLRDENGVAVQEKAKYECMKTLLVAVEAVGMTPPPPLPSPLPVAVVDDVLTGDGDGGAGGGSSSTAAVTTITAVVAETDTTTSPPPRYPPKPPKPSLHQLRQGPSFLSTLPPHPHIIQAFVTLLIAGIEYTDGSRTNPSSQIFRAPSQIAPTAEVTSNTNAFAGMNESRESNAEWGYTEFVRLVLRCGRMYGGFGGVMTRYPPQSSSSLSLSQYYQQQSQNDHQLSYYQQQQQQQLPQQHQQHQQQPQDQEAIYHHHQQAFLSTLLRRQLYQPAVTFFSQHCHVSNNNNNSTSNSSSMVMGSPEVFEWLYMTLVDQHRLVEAGELLLLFAPTPSSPPPFSSSSSPPSSDQEPNHLTLLQQTFVSVLAVHNTNTRLAYHFLDRCLGKNTITAMTALALSPSLLPTSWPSLSSTVAASTATTTTTTVVTASAAIATSVTTAIPPSQPSPPSPSIAALDMALSVATAYHCPSLREELYLAKSLAKIDAFVKKGKWQLALQVASSMPAKLRLFDSLRAMGKYREAQSVYEQCQLLVPPITSQELAMQEGHEDALYLPLPQPLHAIIDIKTVAEGMGLGMGIKSLHNNGDVDGGVMNSMSGLGLRGVLVVDSLATVQLAAQILSDVCVVGVDAEWRAVMEYANKRSHAASTSSSSTSLSLSTLLSLSSSSSSNSNKYSNNNDDHNANATNGTKDKANSSTLTVANGNASASASASASTTVASTTASRGASILQIATPYCVLIFDLNTLSQTTAAPATDTASGLGLGQGLGPASNDVCDQAVHLLQSLFSRDDVIKVGFSFGRSDLAMIRQAGGGRLASAVSAGVRSLLELNKLLNHIRHTDRNTGMSPQSGIASEQMSGTSDSGPVPAAGTGAAVVKKETGDPSSSSSSSLSDACRLLLDQPLNKAEQLSNWDTRPLSSHQLRYASLDAHCLLALLATCAHKHGTTTVTATTIASVSVNTASVSTYPDSAVVESTVSEGREDVCRRAMMACGKALALYQPQPQSSQASHVGHMGGDNSKVDLRWLESFLTTIEES